LTAILGDSSSIGAPFASGAAIDDRRARIPDIPPTSIFVLKAAM
jgi:hypothetical protein